MDVNSERESKLKKLLLDEPDTVVLSKFLKSMLELGDSENKIINIIDSFMESNDISEEYDDELDDLIAAMEGHCSKDYILHPSNFLF